MNTIDSSNSATVITEATGAEISEAVDALAVETLKALLAFPEDAAGGGPGGGLPKDEKSPDWAELEELAQGMTMMGGVPLPSLWIPGSNQTSSSAVALPKGPASLAGQPVLESPGLEPVENGGSNDALGMLAAAVVEEEPDALETPAKALAPSPSDDVPATLGASILESLHRQAPLPAATVAPPVDRTAKIEELLQGLVDRVLVTDPLSGQNREVRIKFQDNILPGTEARVWREDGRVRVEFHTSVAESARWLESMVAGLSQRLDERLSQQAPSLVTVNSSGDAPSDGRSRQRHNPWDLINNGETEADAQP